VRIKNMEQEYTFGDRLNNDYFLWLDSK